MSYDGIVILGVPRSGTTLLRRLLNAHPAIHSPPETYLFGAAGRFLAEQKSAGGLSIGVVPGLAFSDVNEEKVLARLRELVFGFLTELARKAHKPRWAEKTATDAFHADAIARLCGERVRYVLLTRHPLDVVCSIQELAGRMQLHMTELHAYVQRHAAPLEAFAHAWCDGNAALLRLEQRFPRACLRLRYEDLVADTGAQLDRILAFLGEAPGGAELVQKALAKAEDVGLGDWKTYEKQAVESGSVGRASALDPWTVGRLAAIVNPLMAPLGYEPVQPPPLQDEALARRLYQFGRMAAAAKTPKK